MAPQDWKTAATLSPESLLALANISMQNETNSATFDLSDIHHPFVDCDHYTIFHAEIQHPVQGSRQGEDLEPNAPSAAFLERTFLFKLVEAGLV